MGLGLFGRHSAYWNGAGLLKPASPMGQFRFLFLTSLLALLSVPALGLPTSSPAWVWMGGSSTLTNGATSQLPTWGEPNITVTGGNLAPARYCLLKGN